MRVSARGGKLNAGGSTMMIPVFIASDSADALGRFTLVFDIVPSESNAIAPVESLAFVGPTSYDTDPTLIDTAYLYNASNRALPGTASFKYDTGQVFGLTSDTGLSGFETHLVGSNAYDGSDPAGELLLTNTPYLIANLVVTFPTSTMTNPSGELFEVVLDVAHSSFQDGFGSALALSQTTTNNPILATVQVGFPLAPEPGSLTLALVGCASLGLCILVRRRTGTRSLKGPIGGGRLTGGRVQGPT